MNGYQTYSDELLVILLAEDDEEAFSEIYRRYWKILFGIASCRLRNTTLAEDIIHDVFASLWKNHKKVAVSSLEHYLASATRYLVFKAIRKSSNEQRYLQSRQESAVESVIENALHNKRLLEFISRQIETLPTGCRTIFKYSRQQGKTNREIALELNISLKTVENQINKALHHLRFSMRRILQMFL